MSILSSKLIGVVAAIAAVALAVGVVFAVDTSTITFPIVQLGNCQSPQECKTYCSQPANYAACKSFAQSHQLQPQTTEVSDDKQELITQAQNFLGCTDLASCKSFCQQTENHEKCSQLAGMIRLNLNAKAPVSPDIMAAFFQATKAELGCDSQTSCKAFCDVPTNFTRCTQFAKRHNLFRPSPTSTIPKYPPTATGTGILKPTTVSPTGTPPFARP